MKPIKNNTNVEELSLADAVAIDEDSGGLEARAAVELDEQLSGHIGQIRDDLLPMLLHPYGGAVPARMCVHAAHNLKYWVAWESQFIFINIAIPNKNDFLLYYQRMVKIMLGRFRIILGKGQTYILIIQGV